MYTLLSLYDYSGAWAYPFFANGWNVIQLDIKLGFDILELKDVETVFDFGIDDVHGIIAAPPCTDFSVSGAQYWPQKDKDGRTAQAVKLVNVVQQLADLFRPTDEEYDDPFFWSLENPVGRIGKLTGLDDPHWFQPWHFAGYMGDDKKTLTRLSNIRKLNGVDVTAEDAAYVVEHNAYTKKTGLWGEFNRNMTKKPIEPVKVSAQGSFTQRLGGKGDNTKEKRSMTPMGFAWAFYEANKDFKCYKLTQ